MSSYSNYLGAKKCCSNNLAKTVTGPAGPQGSQGAIGPFGQQGSTGSQGLRGATGPCCRGPTGAPGVTGAQGTTGSQGVPGIAGGAGLLLYYNYFDPNSTPPWGSSPPYALERVINVQTPGPGSTTVILGTGNIAFRLNPYVTNTFDISGGVYQSIIYADTDGGVLSGGTLSIVNISDEAGNILVSENQLRFIVDSCGSNGLKLQAELRKVLGQAFDDELESYRELFVGSESNNSVVTAEAERVSYSQNVRPL
jgi:hypothetical protein